MGFGTILGMHNLRSFLFQLKENLPSSSNVKVESHECRSNKRLMANGFNPGLDYLKITKGSEILFEIDAGDDEGYSSSGNADLKAAADKENLEKFLEVYNQLIS